MKALKGGFMATLACTALALPALAFSAPIFSDNFDSDSTTTVTNFTGFANWTVTDGAVDYIRNGSYGITCHGTGGCVDMDGSTNKAGTLVSQTAFSFTAGTAYTLSFWLSGNQRGQAADTLNYGIGGFTGSLSNIPSSQPYSQYSLVFTPTADFSGNILFQLDGSDQYGAILDDVSLSAGSQAVGVPEPGTLGLLRSGCSRLRCPACQKEGV